MLRYLLKARTRSKPLDLTPILNALYSQSGAVVTGLIALQKMFENYGTMQSGTDKYIMYESLLGTLEMVEEELCNMRANVYEVSEERLLAWMESDDEDMARDKVTQLGLKLRKLEAEIANLREWFYRNEGHNDDGE